MHSVQLYSCGSLVMASRITAVLPLHLKWRVNTKQTHLIDRADWRQEEEYEGGRHAWRGEAWVRKMAIEEEM